MGFGRISVWVESRCPLRRYARLVGAPNDAPSLRSVAGLLLALALQSAYEDTSPLPTRFVTAGSNAPDATSRLIAHLPVPSAAEGRPDVLRLIATSFCQLVAQRSFSCSSAVAVQQLQSRLNRFRTGIPKSVLAG